MNNLYNTFIIINTIIDTSIIMFGAQLNGQIVVVTVNTNIYAI